MACIRGRRLNDAEKFAKFRIGYGSFFLGLTVRRASPGDGYFLVARFCLRNGRDGEFVWREIGLGMKVVFTSEIEQKRQAHQRGVQVMDGQLLSIGRHVFKPGLGAEGRLSWGWHCREMRSLARPICWAKRRNMMVSPKPCSV